MVNQIGKFFVHQGDEDVAVNGIADHLKKFWDPRMRLAAFALLREGGQGLDRLPRIALEKLAEQHALTATRYDQIGTAQTFPDVGDVTEA